MNSSYNSGGRRIGRSALQEAENAAAEWAPSGMEPRLKGGPPCPPPMGSWSHKKAFLITAVAMVVTATSCGGGGKIEAFSGKWESTLAADIAGTNKIFIRNGDMQSGREPIYFTIVEPKEVQQFIGSIIVDEERSKLSCACRGWKAIEFYHGDSLLARIGACNAGHFKYAKWPCDAILKQESYNFLHEKYFKGLPGKEER